MNRTSTSNIPTAQPAKNAAPKEKTLQIIRQFARIYMPLSNMPGLVLN